VYWLKVVWYSILILILYIIGIVILPIVLLFSDKELPVFFIFWDDYEHTLYGDTVWRKVYRKNSYKNYSSKLLWVLFKRPLSNFLYFTGANSVIYDMNVKERLLFNKIFVRYSVSENKDGKFPLLQIIYNGYEFKYGYDNARINILPYKKSVPLVLSLRKIDAWSSKKR
jgi:hypothetical protein